MELRDKPFKGCKSISMFGLRDLYYEPKLYDSSLGTIEIEPTTFDIVEMYFITDGSYVYGYYSGMYLLNCIHGTSQVPALIEIKSNKTDKILEYNKAGTRYSIYPAKDIDNSNYLYLGVLDLVENYYDCFEGNVIDCVRYAIDVFKLSKDKIIRLSNSYSERTRKVVSDVFA